jgi:hypothetical protein
MLVTIGGHEAAPRVGWPQCVDDWPAGIELAGSGVRLPGAVAAGSLATACSARNSLVCSTDAPVLVEPQKR